MDAKKLRSFLASLFAAPEPRRYAKIDVMNKEADIDERVILIRINKLYHDFMTPEELYEATRGVWKVGIKRYKADYAFTVYQGEIKEVYKIDSWLPAGTLPYETRRRSDVEIESRWEFKGSVANNEIRNRYIGKTVKSYLPRGASNPIIYVNCK